MGVTEEPRLQDDSLNGKSWGALREKSLNYKSTWRLRRARILASLEALLPTRCYGEKDTALNVDYYRHGTTTSSPTPRDF